MDPLSFTASVVGLVATVTKVSAALSSFVSSMADAPNSAQRTLRAVEEMRKALNMFNDLLLTLSKIPSERKALLRLDDLEFTFTNCIYTMSELESLVCSRRNSGILQRVRWAWMEKKVLRLLPNIESQKSSLALMTTILTCQSDITAHEELKMLRGTLDRMLDNAENYGLQNHHLWRSSDSNTSTELETASSTVPDLIFDGPRLATSEASSRPDTPVSDFEAKEASRRDFEAILEQSRVYSHAEFNSSDISLTSSSVRSHAWSDLSLNDVSTISLFHLPVTLDDIDKFGPDLTFGNLLKGKGLPGKGSSALETKDKPSTMALAGGSVARLPPTKKESGVQTPSTKTFVGRDHILISISNILEGWDRGSPAVVILVGAGGLGKSQIALEYARRKLDEGAYEAVFWVDASSEHTAKLSYVRIWDYLKPGTGLGTEEKFQRARRALQTLTFPWLMILDNFDNSKPYSGGTSGDSDRGPELRRESDSESPGSPSSTMDPSFIQNFIPQNDIGHVIVTTRKMHSPKLGVAIRIATMTPQEAVSLLKCRTLIGAKDSAAWDVPAALSLVEALDYLPLAVELAAANIRQRGLSIPEFMEKFHNQMQTLANRTTDWGERYAGKLTRLGALTLREMSLEAVERHGSKRIRDVALSMLAAAGFLDRTAISIGFLRKLQITPHDQTHVHQIWTVPRLESLSDHELNAAAKLLENWGLIESLTKCSDPDIIQILTVHPIIHGWIRLRMSRPDLRKAAIQAVRLIERNLARDHDALLATSVEFKGEIIRHITSVRELLDKSFPNHGEETGALNLGSNVLAQATISFASFHYDLGDLSTAEELFELVRRQHGQNPGDNNPLCIQAEEGLALIRLWEEDGKRAFDLLDHAVKGYRRLPNNYTKPLYRSIHNLGEVECFRKNFYAAIGLFTTSLQGFTDEFGKESKEVYREIEALGNAYRALGDIEQAERLVREAWQKLDQLDPSGDAAMNATESLALVIKAKGEFEHAEQLYRKVISAYEHSLGRDQYTTIGAIAGLADTYRKARQWQQARAAYAEIMARLGNTLAANEDPQYVRAREAYLNLSSGNPDPGPQDDFSYPWPRAVGEFQTRPSHVMR